MKPHNNLLALVTALALPFATQAQAPAPEVPAAEAPAVAVQTTAPQPAPVDLSPGAAEVIRLAESGVGDDVVIAFIRNSQASFTLGADHVVYLKDLGLSEQVISTMLTHDTELRSKGPQTATVTNPPPAPTVAATELTAAAPAPAVVEQPAPVYVSEPPVEVSYFYNDLAPYGTWVSLEGYGWCWQPRTVVVNRAWQPYCDGGHWVYSDCGWYWQSDYSWGWAPFHYGRWQLHNRCGWVWLPDRVWGPAWVTWRTSGDYCGWAPLPPRAYYDGSHGWRYNGVSVGISFGFGLHADHFTFVAFNSFTDHDLRHHRVGHNDVRNVYNRTTVNNNYTIVNNTVINNGVPVDRVASATHREIRRASVRDLPSDSARRSPRQTSDRNESVVFRKEPRAPAAPIRATAQKVDNQHPVIQHPTIAASSYNARSGRNNAGSSVTERRTGTTWQTPQRSTSERSSTYNRPQSTSARQAAPAPSAPSTVQQSPTRNTPTRSTSTWQTPSRPEKNSSPQTRLEQSTPPAVSPPPAARSVAPEKPAAAVQPNRSTWETPAGRSRSQTAPNVVQTVPQQGNPHVYYPKSSPQSQGVRSGQSAAPPPVQGTVRSAPPSSNAGSNSRWQSGTRVDSASRGNSGNPGNSDKASKNRD